MSYHNDFKGIKKKIKVQITVNDATERLAPHISALYKIPHEAWVTYLNDIPEKMRMIFCRRTRASALHNLMIDKAAQYADSVEGVKLFETNKLYGLMIENIAIRFKKFNELNLSSNQLTKQVVNFRNQVQIEGIDAVHYLELGYSLDTYEREISQITLTCPSGVRSNLWELEINDSSTTSIIEDIFDAIKTEYIEPAKIKPKQKSIIVPFRKTAGEQGANDNNEEIKR